MLNELNMLVYKENPFLALVPKNESPSKRRQGLRIYLQMDGFAGKYIPRLMGM